MKEGGSGGNCDSNVKTKSWCNSCRRLSAPMMATTPSSPSSPSWKRRNSVLKVAMSLAVVLLILSIYQSCVLRETSFPVWLSLSFTSRQSFILSSPELSTQHQERPASHLVEAFSPTSLNLNLSPLPLADAFSVSSISETASSELRTGDKESRKSGNFETHNGSMNRLQQPLGTDPSGAATKNELPVENSVKKDEFEEIDTSALSETPFTEGDNSNSSDSRPFSAERDELKESGTFMITEAASMESGKDDGSNKGKKSEDGGVEKHLGGVGFETRAEADAGTLDQDGVLQQGNSSDFAAIPATVQELSQPSVDTQMASPSQITENPVDKQRVKFEQLSAAKQAIEEATVADSDPTLYHVIYKNVSAFSKSYKLMEEIFKIYVYKEGKPPLVHTGPLLGIYASEGKFIDIINRGSSFVVEDPELAHMFYLPYSVTQMTLTIYVEGSHSMQPLNDFVKDYVDLVAMNYPFWNRTRGADHFFLSCHDWGPATARHHKELRVNAMKVVCNADVTEEYVVGKDASLPEIYLHNHKPVKVGGPGATRRSFLAFFAGQMHGHVRPLLIEHWKDKDPDLKIYEGAALPKDIDRKMNYIEHMKNSKYCICAAGFEVNSPRIVESIYYDCVPVIIADNFVLPFSDVLNWNAFSVTIPESEIPNLKSILLGISDRQYRAMQKRLSKVRQHFLWNDEPVKYDVFHMIMHSVWMSRLNRLNL